MYDPTIEPPSDRTFSMSSPSELNPQWWHGEPVSYEVFGKISNESFQGGLSSSLADLEFGASERSQIGRLLLAGKRRRYTK